jgi:hypothetical protein
MFLPKKSFNFFGTCFRRPGVTAQDKIGPRKSGITVAGMQVAGIHADTAADNLFFTTYRSWMAGFTTRDTACWNYAWQTLARAVPRDVAKVLYGEFHFFTQTLRNEANREIAWRPDTCRCLCYDECLVLALISASQLQEPVEEATVAGQLVGSHKVNPLIHASRSLAFALKARDLVLEPVRKALLSRLGLTQEQSQVLH